MLQEENVHRENHVDHDRQRTNGYDGAADREEHFPGHGDGGGRAAVAVAAADAAAADDDDDDHDDDDDDYNRDDYDHDDNGGGADGGPHAPRAAHLRSGGGGGGGGTATQERAHRVEQERRALVAPQQPKSGAATERRDEGALRLRAAGRGGERLCDPGGDRDREACVPHEEKQGRAQGETVDAAADQERLLRRAPRAELHRTSDHAVSAAVRAESPAFR